jgi:hypothetical protein
VTGGGHIRSRRMASALVTGSGIDRLQCGGWIRRGLHACHELTRVDVVLMSARLDLRSLSSREPLDVGRDTRQLFTRIDCQVAGG